METTKLTKSLETKAFIADFRKEAKNNPVFMLVMKKFATRLRNRNTLTPAALKLAMSKDDVNYPKGKYSEILKFMSTHGVGHLDLGPRGQIRSLNRIPIDLKELGHIVTRDLTDEAQTAAPKEEPTKATAPPPPEAAKTATPSPAAEPSPSAYDVQLLVHTNNYEQHMPGVANLSPEQAAEFISKFFLLCRRYAK